MSSVDPQTPKKRQRPQSVQLLTPPPSDRKHRSKRTPLFLPSSPTPSPSTSSLQPLLYESLHLRPDGTILGCAPHPVYRATTPVGGLLQNDPFGSDDCEIDLYDPMDDYIAYPSETAEMANSLAPKDVPSAKYSIVSPLALQRTLHGSGQIEPPGDVEIGTAVSCTEMVLWQPPEAYHEEDDDSSSDEIVCTGQSQAVKAGRSPQQKRADPPVDCKRKRKTTDHDNTGDLEALSERKKELARRRKRMLEAAAKERERELREETLGQPGERPRPERSPSSVSLREITSDDEIQCLGQSASSHTVKSRTLAVAPRKEGVISSEQHKKLMRAIIGRLARFEFSPLLLYGSRTWADICVAIGLPNNQLHSDRARRDVAKTFDKFEKLLDNGQL